MLTTDELRDQLVADVLDAPTNVDRTSQVRGRVSVVRRRRAIGTGVAALAGLAVAALVVVPQLNDDASGVLPSTHRGPSDVGEVPLSQYHQGGLLIAESEHRGSGAYSVPFIASSSRLLMFTIDCFVPDSRLADELILKLTIHGVQVGMSSCTSDGDFGNAGGSVTFTPDPASLASVNPGERSDVRVSWTDGVPTESRVRLGVYERVTPEEYHYPPQPDPLPPLEPSGNLTSAAHEGSLALVSAGPLPADLGPTSIVGPVGTWSQTVTLEHGLSLETTTVAPGRLTIRVDDKVVDVVEGWDYTNSGYGNSLTLEQLGVQAGQPVKLTVTAERFPGDSWAVLLADEAP